jgi:hypothetical protein
MVFTVMDASTGLQESFVDDLCTGRGVVLGRAATTLRSIETHDRTHGLSRNSHWSAAAASALYMMYGNHQCQAMQEFCEELCGMGELLNAIVMQLYFCYIYLLKNQ